jgi:hypothetical protein
MKEMAATCPHNLPTIKYGLLLEKCGLYKELRPPQKRNGPLSNRTQPHNYENNGMIFFNPQMKNLSDSPSAWLGWNLSPPKLD